MDQGLPDNKAPKASPADARNELRNERGAARWVALVGKNEAMTEALIEALNRYDLEASHFSTTVEFRAQPRVPVLVLLVGDATKKERVALDLLSVRAWLARQAGNGTIALLARENSLEARIEAFHKGAAAVIPRGASVDAIAQRVAELVEQSNGNPGKRSGASFDVGEASLSDLISLIEKELRHGILSASPVSGNPVGGSVAPSSAGSVRAASNAALGRVSSSGGTLSSEELGSPLRVVLGSGKPIAEAVRDFVERLRPHVSEAEPWAYEFRELWTDDEKSSVSKNPDFKSLRVVLVDAEADRADLLAGALRGAGAEVVVLNPSQADVARVRDLDPQVVVHDERLLHGELPAFLAALRRDLRLRWAGIVAVPFASFVRNSQQSNSGSRSPSGSNVDLPALMSHLQSVAEQETKLYEQLLSGDAVETDLSPFGAARILRIVESLSASFRLVFSHPKATVIIDVVSELIVSAHARTSQGPRGDGFSALALILSMGQGRVAIERTKDPAIGNLMVPVTEALSRASDEIPDLFNGPGRFSSFPPPSRAHEEQGLTPFASRVMQPSQASQQHTSRAGTYEGSGPFTISSLFPPMTTNPSSPGMVPALNEPFAPMHGSRSGAGGDGDFDRGDSWTGGTRALRPTSKTASFGAIGKDSISEAPPVAFDSSTFDATGEETATQKVSPLSLDSAFVASQKSVSARSGATKMEFGKSEIGGEKSETPALDARLFHEDDSDEPTDLRPPAMGLPAMGLPTMAASPMVGDPIKELVRGTEEISLESEVLEEDVLNENADSDDITDSGSDIAALDGVTLKDGDDGLPALYDAETPFASENTSDADLSIPGQAIPFPNAAQNSPLSVDDKPADIVLPPVKTRSRTLLGASALGLHAAAAAQKTTPDQRRASDSESSETSAFQKPSIYEAGLQSPPSVTERIPGLAKADLAKSDLANIASATSSGATKRAAAPQKAPRGQAIALRWVALLGLACAAFVFAWVATRVITRYWDQGFPWEHRAGTPPVYDVDAIERSSGEANAVVLAADDASVDAELAVDAEFAVVPDADAMDAGFDASDADSSLDAETDAPAEMVFNLEETMEQPAQVAVQEVPQPAVPTEVEPANGPALAPSTQAGASTLSALRRALEENPRDHHAMVALAEYHLQHNESAAAIPLLQQAIAKRPSRGSYRVLLGDALNNTGDAEGARAEWERALEISPNDRSILRRLGR